RCQIGAADGAGDAIGWRLESSVKEKERDRGTAGERTLAGCAFAPERRSKGGAKSKKPSVRVGRETKLSRHEIVEGLVPRDRFIPRVRAFFAHGIANQAIKTFGDRSPPGFFGRRLTGLLDSLVDAGNDDRPAVGFFQHVTGRDQPPR